MTKAKGKNPNIEKRGLAVRHILQKYVKKYATTKEKRLELAEFLDIEETSVNNMLFGSNAPGSLDRWVSAVHFCKKINTSRMDAVFEDFEKFMKKNEPFSTLDKLYFDLCNIFDENHLIFLFGLIKHAAKPDSKKRG